VSDEYELPDCWEVKSLGETAKLVKDKVEPSTVPDAHYVGLEHVEANTMKLLGSGRGSDVKSTKTRFKAGDILYGKLRPYLNKVTRPSFDGISSTDFLVFTESDSLDPGYLAQFLNQLSVANFAHHLSAGVELPRVNWTSLGSLPITFPSSKRQQRAIVQSIEHVRTLAASADAHLSRARAAIEQFRRAILAAACSGRLTADWRESNGDREESARQLVERSQKSIAASGRKRPDDVWSEPDWIDLPLEWVWAPMRDLAEIRGGIQKQPKRAPKTNTHPYLRVANVLRGRVDLREMREFELFDGELMTYRLERGDILVVEGNGSPTEIGRAAIWMGEIPDCVHQNHIIRVRCAAMNPQFVELFWNSPIGAREIAALAVTSAGLYSLSTKKIGAVPVPVAPIEEQEEIVRRATALLATADALLVRVTMAARKVDRTSQALLAKAFRGELITPGEEGGGL